MFKCYGKIQVSGGIRVMVGGDICQYYRQLFTYDTYFTKKSQLPAHGAHISVILPDIHKILDYSPALKYSGKVVEFYYNPEDVFISKKNVWVNVDLPIGKEIKDLFKVKEENFWGYHLVVCNFKGL